MARLKQIREVLGADQKKELPLFIDANDTLDFETIQRQDPTQKIFFIDEFENAK